MQGSGFTNTDTGTLVMRLVSHMPAANVVDPNLYAETAGELVARGQDPNFARVDEHLRRERDDRPRRACRSEPELARPRGGRSAA